MTTEISLVDLMDALLRFAAADMRLARREGSILIGGTVHGNVGLAYDREARAYTLTAGSTVIASGRAGIVRLALARAYKIVDE